MTCEAIRQNDQMCCGQCGLQWDLEDPAPPTCALLRPALGTEEPDKPHMRQKKSITPEARQRGLVALRAMRRVQEDDVIHKCANCQSNEIQQCTHGQWGAGSGVNRDTLQVLMNVDNSKCTKWRLKR